MPPPTLEKQLEALAAARFLVTSEDEFWRRRRQEIAAIRRRLGALVVLHLELQRQWGELVLLDQELRRRRYPRLRSHVVSDDFHQSAAAKASPDDPKHPGWPAGTLDARGGKYRPKGDGEGEGATAAIIPVAYGPNPHFPPVPPGYDPKT